MPACSLLLVCLALMLSAAVSASDTPLPPVNSLPAVRELPDPFLFQDGTRVHTRRDWMRRRQEIKLLAQHYVYGYLPAAGDAVRADLQSSTTNAQTGATEQTLLLTMGSGGRLHIRLYVTTPPQAKSQPVGQKTGQKRQKRLPAIICGDVCWGRVTPDIVAEAMQRGYILAEFDRTEIVPDKNEPNIHAPKSDTRDSSNGQTESLRAITGDADMGAMAAWAWGYERVADYLAGRPDVDGKRLAITGHSRGGKAVLLAGCMDERIALTAPNDAGCMGTGCTRLPHQGETLAIIQKNFPYWFSPRLAEFAGREERLPFDQHTLKALVAPRALLETEALQDEWANPRGAQITYQAAKTVFDFLGAGDKIGIAYREGGHAHILPDWLALLDFADKQFFGKQTPRKFDALPYPEANPKPYHWTAAASE